MLLDRAHHFAEESGVELVQEAFEMVKIPKLAQLFADLRTGGGEGGEATISDLIIRSRPPEENYDWTGGLGHINHPAEWLITWVTELEPRSEKAYSAVLHGYGNALQVQKETLYN